MVSSDALLVAVLLSFGVGIIVGGIMMFQVLKKTYTRKIDELITGLVNQGEIDGRLYNGKNEGI